MTEFIFGAGVGSGQFGDWLVRVLAVLGAAAVGAFGMGIFTNLATRLIRSKPLPKPILTTLRVMAAVVGGWLVALLLFHSGGSGWGWGSGSGGLGGTSSSDGSNSTAPDGKAGLTSQSVPETRDDSFRVEVLVPAADKSDRYYRVEESNRLGTLEELKSHLSDRLHQTPALKYLNIVIYQDSPDESTHQVRDVEQLAKDAGLEIRFYKPNKKAP